MKQRFFLGIKNQPTNKKQNKGEKKKTTTANGKKSKKKKKAKTKEVPMPRLLYILWVSICIHILLYVCISNPVVLARGNITPFLWGHLAMFGERHWLSYMREADTNIWWVENRDSPNISQ